MQHLTTEGTYPFGEIGGGEVFGHVFLDEHTAAFGDEVPKRPTISPDQLARGPNSRSSSRRAGATLRRVGSQSFNSADVGTRCSTKLLYAWWVLATCSLNGSGITNQC